MNEIVDQPLTSPLELAVFCFQGARRNIVAGMSYLYQVDKENLWEGKYSSFSEFVEQDCQLSKGYASKLVQAWEHYVITGGVSEYKLQDIDAEKLYLAMRLPVAPEQQVIRAGLWSRSELKQELASTPEGDCQHDCEHITICSRCSKRV